MNETGLITVNSAYPVAKTLELVQSTIVATGMTVFALFDHAAAARAVGLALRPTTVVTFGNPAAGTKLMQADQVVGLDLPLKILVWEDQSGAARMTYTDPRWMAERHKLDSGTEPVIAAMARLLDSLTQRVASAEARAS